MNHGEEKGFADAPNYADIMGMCAEMLGAVRSKFFCPSTGSEIHNAQLKFSMCRSRESVGGTVCFAWVASVSCAKAPWKRSATSCSSSDAVLGR